ncbi:hypothetical protein SS209_02196 [Salmonella enterica subsp. enterica serovar Senftenberg str. SS209]|nr:hypothetical protein SS209_02196 [Salmonella enterica subsp. enterica serovar Senftenberg str. SS209]
MRQFWLRYFAARKKRPGWLA